VPNGLPIDHAGSTDSIFRVSSRLVIVGGVRPVCEHEDYVTSLLPMTRFNVPLSTVFLAFFAQNPPAKLLEKSFSGFESKPLRVYPESYAALFLTYLNGIGFCASSGASRLIIPPMVLILIQASLDSVRRS
jgi:hypothetical protein